MDNNLLFDINQYEKKEKIGGDTYGEVFKVIYKNTNEQYAAKISLYEENLDLTREINNLAAIDHPSILKFIGYSPVNFYGEPKPVNQNILSLRNFYQTIHYIVFLKMKGKDWQIEIGMIPKN